MGLSGGVLAIVSAFLPVSTRGHTTMGVLQIRAPLLICGTLSILLAARPCSTRRLWRLVVVINVGVAALISVAISGYLAIWINALSSTTCSRACIISLDSVEEVLPLGPGLPVALLACILIAVGGRLMLKVDK